MRKYIIDFVFNERTGSSNIVVDFVDTSMTSLEIHEGIRDGSLRDELLDTVSKVFGEKIANDVRGGKIDMICLDDHPEEKQPILTKQDEQPSANKKENVL